MFSEYTLDDDVMAHIQGADKVLKSRNDWSAFDFKIMFNKLETIINLIQERYVDLSGITMPEAFKQICKGIFNGSLKTFINYTNGILYVRKLQAKLKRIRERSYFGNERI